jgi:3-methylcrotonyl-CoA carboxylase alpha subunit
VCGAAVKAAQAVDYVGAGTIEFIADASEGLRADRIWFMEMNTRLQVEHPVTEEITGQDLVEWQLRVASGEPLPKRQEELSIHGHAMEARLYAEDPAKEFLPSIGNLDNLYLPDSVRIDTGVEEGDTISPFYDPMIAKLIAHAEDRSAAIARLEQACRQVVVEQPKTNAWFLARLLADPDFGSGAVSTGHIAAHADTLLQAPQPSPVLLQEAAESFVTADRFVKGAMGDIDYELARGLYGFRLNAPRAEQVGLRLNGEPVEVDLPHAKLFRLNVSSTGSSVLGETHVFHESGAAFAFTLSLSGAGGAASAAAGDGSLISPMPGRVIAVEVRQGDTVSKGQKLLTLEAMKMEHSLLAPFDGIVAELEAREGAQVTEGTLLVRVEKGE